MNSVNAGANQSQALQPYRPPNNNFPPQPQYQPRQHTPSSFSVPTTGDSLSSGFDYDVRLQQLLVTPTEWATFTHELVEAAKLSFSENKKAWSVGLTLGTAGTMTLLFVGPIVGYYAGKKIHRQAVIDKAREGLLQDGKLSNVLRKWNEGEWGARGINVNLEFPDVRDKSRANAKKFRVLITPGRASIVGFPMRSQIQSPQRPELMGEQVGQVPSRRDESQQFVDHQKYSQEIHRPETQVLMAGALQTDSRHGIAGEYQEEGPALPSRPVKVPLLDSTPIHELPNIPNQRPAELSSTPITSQNTVEYHELDGGGVR